VPIRPEEIDSTSLPVVIRGYERESTDELLKRIAWDYHLLTRSEAAAAEEAKRLRRRVDELESEAAEARQAVEGQLALQRAELERDLHERTAAFDAEAARLRQQLSELERRDELTRTLLANAQRGARELREATRVECEGLLKAARRRAAEIEGDAHVSVRRAAADVERLHRLEADLRDQLRRTLQAVLEPPRPEPAPEHEQQPPLGVG
jgi:cell division septum initiation protein DivIVA